MTQAELEIAQEKLDYLMQQRIEIILEGWIVQGGILFAFIGILLSIFGLRKVSMVFFALYAWSILSLPSTLNMLLGGMLLVAMGVHAFIKQQPAAQQAN